MLALADHADENMEAFPSLARLASYANVDRRNAIRAVQALIAAGELVRRGTAPRGTTVYRIALPEPDTGGADATSAGDDSATTNGDDSATRASGVRATGDGFATGDGSATRASGEFGAGSGDSVTRASGDSATRTPIKPPEEPPIEPPACAGAAARATTGGPRSTTAKGATIETWDAYAESYRMRYDVEPVRNARVNGQLAQVVKRIGADEAPKVARFFVAHNDRWYLTKGHSVACLLADCEKLRTEWKTGRKITGARARQIERASANLDAYQELVEEYRREAES